jgi:hypothetical protein
MMIGGGENRRGGAERTVMAIPPSYLMENSDKHRRNILEDVLRFGAIEERGVLPELVRDLVNDETATIGQGFVGFLQQGPLLLDLENAEWDPRKDVIALRNAAAF